MNITTTDFTNWHCKILFNSDSPDPVWNLDEDTARQLLDQIILADPYEMVFEIPVTEGYRGVELSNENEVFTAFKGQIKHLVNNQEQPPIADIGRSFEQMVLRTASGEPGALAQAQLHVDFD